MKTIHLGPAIGFRLLNSNYEPLDPLVEFEGKTVFDFKKTPTQGMVQLKNESKTYYLVDTAKLKKIHPIGTPRLPALSFLFGLGLFIVTLLSVLLGYLIGYTFFPLKGSLPFYMTYSPFVPIVIVFLFVVYKSGRYSVAKNISVFFSLSNVILFLFFSLLSLGFLSGEVPNFILNTQLPGLDKLAKSNLACMQVGYLGLAFLACSLYSFLIYGRINQKLGWFQVNWQQGSESKLYSMAIDLGFANLSAAYGDDEGKLKRVITLRKRIWYPSVEDGKISISIAKKSSSSTIKSSIKMETDPSRSFNSVLFRSLYAPSQEEEMFLHKHQLFEELGEYPYAYQLVQAHLQNMVQSIYYSLLREKKEKIDEGMDWYFSHIGFTHPVLAQSSLENFKRRVTHCLNHLKGVALEFFPEPLAALEGFRREIRSKDKEEIFRETTLLVDVGDGTTDLTLAKGGKIYSISLPVGARRCVSACLRSVTNDQGFLERGEALWQQMSDENNRESPLGTALWRQAFKMDGIERRDLPGFGENLSLIAWIAHKTNPGILLFSGLGATNHSLKSAIIEKISETGISASPIVILGEHLRIEEEGEEYCPHPMKGVTVLGALDRIIHGPMLEEKETESQKPFAIDDDKMVATIKNIFLLDGDNQWPILAHHGFPQFVRCHDVEERLTATKFYTPLTYYNKEELKKFAFLKIFSQSKEEIKS